MLHLCCICATIQELGRKLKTGTMIDRFTRFEGSPNGKYKDMVRVTLSPRKFLGLNARAFQALGSPNAIEFYFDEHEKKIALRRCDPNKKYAFRVRKEKGKEYYVVYAAAFCTHYLIKTKRTVLFDDPEQRPDFMLVLDMAKTINVNRGSR